MKLSKLYSNKPFRNITFFIEKGGLNVILGDAQGKKEQSNSHNLGKSKLGELLDFMLLKEHYSVFFYKKATTKKAFLKKEYQFYLEILLNNGQYLTIRRTLDKPTKIAFKLNAVRSKDYIFYENFDKNLTFDKAKSYLNELLDFDFCKENNESYRRLVNYSLRKQGDYVPSRNTLFHLQKFGQNNKDKEWKPLIFSLLGFNGHILQKKYELEDEIRKTEQTIEAQEKDFNIKSEEKDLLVGKIQNAESEKEELSKKIGSLNFYTQDKKTIYNLVGKIEEEIAELNTLAYNLEYDINKLENSIRNKFSFDLDKVKAIFEDVDLHFPKQLSKSYEELIDFNRKITRERNAQIRETLKEKQVEEVKVNDKLSALHEQKDEHRELIQDTTLFKKYSTYQKQLIGIENELSRFQTQLEAIEKIQNKKTQIKEKKDNELREVKGEIKHMLENTANCELYMRIRKSFADIVKYILGDTALITITPNSNYNIDFKPEFPKSAKDDGGTYYKMLCVAFDLAVLINYQSKSHFRFVYHDDVISGDDNGVKTRLINIIRRTCEKYDIQYIYSAVKDNIPPTQDLSDNIILELHDKYPSGKLFKMDF